LLGIDTPCKFSCSSDALPFLLCRFRNLKGFSKLPKFKVILGKQLFALSLILGHDDFYICPVVAVFAEENRKAMTTPTIFSSTYTATLKRSGLRFFAKVTNLNHLSGNRDRWNLDLHGDLLTSLAGFLSYCGKVVLMSSFVISL
jgi:hypothetical protein